MLRHPNALAGIRQASQKAADPYPPAPAVQVRNGQGRWVAGFDLLAFNPDGTATIRSRRTGEVRTLPPDDWRDPAELEALAALTGEVAL